MGIRVIILYIGHRDRLYPPGMVDEDLSVHAEGSVKVLLVVLGLFGYLPHGKEHGTCKPCGLSGADLPEIRKRPVIPQEIAVGLLGKLCYADTVSVGRGLLGNDVHRHLCKIQICPYPYGRRYACCTQDILYYRQGKEAFGACIFPKGLCPVKMKISGAVNKAFIDGVYMDILGRQIS